MKTLDLTQKLKNIDGDIDEQLVPIKYDELVDGEIVQKTKVEKMSLTLGKLLEHCLFHRDAELTEKEVLQRIDMIERIHNQEQVKLEDDEISLLKKLILKKYDVFFGGQALRMLNQ